MTSGYDFTTPSSPVARTMTWNADNMPSTITSGSTTATFLYDGTGTRAKKTVGSTTTYYIGDHYERKGGVAYRYIFAGNLRIAQVKGSASPYEVAYFHKDHLGSSTLMTNSSGTVIETSNYEPFGGMRAHTGTTTSSYKFTDQELDAENGLYNYDARLYDPIIGRFITPDSITSNWFDPQSLNKYAYARNNPLIYTDPTGHIALADNLIGAGIAAGVDFGLQYYRAYHSGTPFQWNWHETAIAGAAGFVTSGLSTFWGGMATNIGGKFGYEAFSAGTILLRSGGNAMIGGGIGAGSTGALNLWDKTNLSWQSGALWGAVGGASGSVFGDLFPASSSSNNLNWFNSFDAGQKNWAYGFAEQNGFTINPSIPSSGWVVFGTTVGDFFGNIISSSGDVSSTSAGATTFDDSTTLNIDSSFTGSISQYNQQQEYPTCDLCEY